MPTSHKHFKPLALVLCATLSGGLVASIGASAASKLAGPRLENPNETTGAVTASGVKLTWSAVGGAARYIVRRETKTYKVNDGDGKGDQIGSTTKVDIATDVVATAYEDTSFPSSDGLQTTYLSYKVRGVDSEGREGNASNQVEVRVPKAGGESGPLTAPGKPGGFTSTSTPKITISFTFAPATGGVAPIKYIVRRTGGTSPTEEFTTDAASYKDVSAKLKTDQTYTYKVKAVDAAGNIGPLSPTAQYKIRT